MTLSSGKVISREFKKVFEPKGCLFQNEVVLAYGLAGDAHARLVLERLMAEEGGLLAGDNLESEDDFEALIVCEESVFYVEKSGDKPAVRALEINPAGFWAIGSGSPIATYLLNKGASLQDALFEAIESDVFSGGEITTWGKNAK